MHYVVAAKGGPSVGGGRVVADGEIVSLEAPWSFGPPTIVRVDDAPAAGGNGFAFAVEGFAEPTSGNAFVIAAHMMRDPEGFKPYAVAVPDVIKSFGGRFLARGGKVTPIAGPLVPDRVVLIEFPNADDVIRFYFSDAYAPLLKIRLATTEPRFVLIARSGMLPDQIRSTVAEQLSRAK